MKTKKKIILIEGTKFARKCDVTGEGMNSGYCIGDGEAYVKDDEKLFEKYLKENTKYKNANDAYADEYYYHTEWEMPADAQYIVKNGMLVDFEDEQEEKILNIRPTLLLAQRELREFYSKDKDSQALIEIANILKQN